MNTINNNPNSFVQQQVQKINQQTQPQQTQATQVEQPKAETNTIGKSEFEARKAKFEKNSSTQTAEKPQLIDEQAVNKLDQAINQNSSVNPKLSGLRPNALKQVHEESEDNESNNEEPPIL